MAKLSVDRAVRRNAMIVLLFFIGAFALLSLRVLAIQVGDYARYQEIVIDQLTREAKINAERGDIYDTNMEVLATNVTVWRVFISPRDIAAAEEARLKAKAEGGEKAAAASDIPQAELIAAGLAEILGESAEVQADKVLELAADTKKLDKTVARNVEEEEAKAVRAFIAEHNLQTQIYLEATTKRAYNYDNLAAHVLGFTGTDGNGLFGLEKEYDEQLSGEPGRYIIARDAYAREMPFKYQSYIDAKDGYNLVTTINMRIQYELERQLEATLIESGAGNRVCGIVMDVNTGAIRAMATKGDFDLNDPWTLDEASAFTLANSGYAEGSEEYKALLSELRYAMWNNKAVTELYEPGSTFKILTSAMCLEEKVVSPSDPFYCSGSLMVEGWSKPIHCHKTTGHGHVTFTTGLQQSCNPVLMTIAQRLGISAFVNYFNAFGYMEKTGIDLPGEASTIFHSSMSIVDLATASFGQNFKVTPINQLTAICAVANGGYLVTPHLYDRFVDDEGNVIERYTETARRQVVSTETCRTLIDILEEGVSGDGGAKNAYVAGYRVAAKTGTSEKRDKLDANGEKSFRVGSCVAFAPAEDPQIAVLIMVDEPMNGRVYGSIVAAPYVANLLKVVLPYMGIEASYTEAELAKLEVNLLDYTGWLVEDAITSMGYVELDYTVVGDGTKVTAQIPAGGSQLAKDTGRVIFYCGDAQPEDTVTVPDVMGRSASAANKLLIDAGLNIRIEGTQNYQSGAGAVVVAQSPAGDTVVTPGTIVTVEFRYLDGTD
ncbi:MAG: PASTA domain-containing protein [Clostridia bacterium]|nr:PASTA domain-containing protein [Clostridia bacterium]